MQIDTYPVFKKPYTPWYDSNAICVLIILFLLAVCGFSVVGIELAIDTSEFEGHVGLPVTLLLLSASVIISTAIRLFLRFLRRDDRR